MYLKDKNFNIGFRIDKTLYNKLIDMYSAYQKIIPNITFSDFLRKILEDFAFNYKKSE